MILQLTYSFRPSVKQFVATRLGVKFARPAIKLNSLSIFPNFKNTSDSKSKYFINQNSVRALLSAGFECEGASWEIVFCWDVPDTARKYDFSHKCFFG
jgi:hypothetical protein